MLGFGYFSQTAGVGPGMVAASIARITPGLIIGIPKRFIHFGACFAANAIFPWYIFMAKFGKQLLEPRCHINHSLLSEIPIQQALERLAVTRLVIMLYRIAYTMYWAPNRQAVGEG